MAAFNFFKFLDDRRRGLPVSELDKDEFQLYNVVQALSMDPSLRKITHELNELSFSHLPRDIQAMTFNGLNNVHWSNRWNIAKGEVVRAKKEQIDHIMKVTGLSNNDVVHTLRYGLFDLDAIEEEYARIYEPEKLLALLTKKKKAPTRKVHAAKVNGNGK